ncbi:hypothetical protein SDC9_88936 [bioreactor metagenome]|uniref:Uncharacterized protein n=1 Tax=bioreactor metagenome TaxID=1076179 RepID=A0A644ZQV8_9ZZZZ
MEKSTAFGINVRFFLISIVMSVKGIWSLIAPINDLSIVIMSSTADLVFNSKEVKLACASKSIINTLYPRLDKLYPTKAVVEVFPTPPLKLAKLRTVAAILYLPLNVM